jgi:hypothetical protein
MYFSHTSATRAAHLTHFDVIIIKEYKPWIFPSYNYIHPPIISFLLGPIIRLRILFSTPTVCVVPLMWETVAFWYKGIGN